MWLVRGFVLLIGAFIISRFAGTSLRVEKQDWCKVLAFALTGTFGMVFLLFGVTMVPLLVQSTLLNTAPFWASLLGCVFLKETLARIEIIALFLSFVGVLLVTLSTKLDETEVQMAGEEEQEGLSSKFAFLIGCLFVIIASWVEAIITLIARRMQNVSFSVMLFWYGCVAVPINLAIVVGESWFNEVSIRFWSYDGGQYGWLFLITILNFIGFCA